MKYNLFSMWLVFPLLIKIFQSTWFIRKLLALSKVWDSFSATTQVPSRTHIQGWELPLLQSDSYGQEVPILFFPVGMGVQTLTGGRSDALRKAVFWKYIWIRFSANTPPNVLPHAHSHEASFHCSERFFKLHFGKCLKTVASLIRILNGGKSSSEGRLAFCKQSKVVYSQTVNQRGARNKMNLYSQPTGVFLGCPGFPGEFREDVPINSGQVPSGLG